MEEKIRYNFWDQIPIAFFKPQAYKCFLPIKKKFLAGFVLFVVALSFLLEYGIPFAAWDVSVGGIENLITNGIPKFTLEGGVLNMESPMDINMNGVIHIAVNTDKENYSQKDMKEEYVEEILLSKNNMLIKHTSMVSEVKFADHQDFKMDNASLLELVPFIKGSFLFTGIFIFLTKIAMYLVSTLFFSILCRVGIRTKDGKTIGASEAFCFSIYGRSLFMILTSVNICLGYIINNFFVTIFGVFFTMRYIFRAEVSYLGTENMGLNGEK